MKAAATALQHMGVRLAKLSHRQLAGMALPAELMTAIEALWKMTSRGARRRQVQYIGSLMRRVDVTEIEGALMEIEQGVYRQARMFRRLESWRDRLVDGDDALLRTLLIDYPHADRQRLGQLVRSARAEKARGAPPRSARNLFRYLRELTKTPPTGRPRS